MARGLDQESCRSVGYAGVVIEDSDALAAVAAVRGGDVLLDVTNPGRWMAHCHIAERHESGMMLSFDVLPANAV